MNRLLPALLAVVSTATAANFDWPQFRGPERTDVSAETGLLQEWPAEGPKQLWIYKNAGNGYSGPALVAGALYTLGSRDGKEIALSLEADTGAERWATPLADVLDNGWGGGPRGTPAVDGDKVYVITGSGAVACLEAKDGKVVWQHTMKELGGNTPGWEYTESILVDGDQVVCTPGGSKGALAALDKKTGDTLWQSKEFTDGAQYSSIIPAVLNGQPQYVQRSQTNVVGISAKDGALLWKVPYPGKTAVIPTPIVKGNQVYVTAGYGVGSLSFVVEKGNETVPVFDETAATNKVMKNHHGGVVLVGDFLYGYSDGVGWTCQDFKTGGLVWAEKAKLGKGAVTYADGMLYCLDESKGTVVLIEASPKGWAEHGRFTLDPLSQIRSKQGHIWTHPVISNGRLYLRDQDLIYCYAVK
ncbi:MAG TPA: PQQ-binding-like beta-propeller repeat protein [Chthoniobacteraceae bacterium]|jgi:outer membrane protein assembly factor BamB|nr:PQQ-binding-like beta-propeller repeat protein [Chthoniobacteraceae bacterium]